MQSSWRLHRHHQEYSVISSPGIQGVHFMNIGLGRIELKVSRALENASNRRTDPARRNSPEYLSCVRWGKRLPSPVIGVGIISSSKWRRHDLMDLVSGRDSTRTASLQPLDRRTLRWEPDPSCQSGFHPAHQPLPHVESNSRPPGIQKDICALLAAREVRNIGVARQRVRNLPAGLDLPDLY